MELELGLSLLSNNNSNEFEFQSKNQKKKVGLSPWTFNGLDSNHKCSFKSVFRGTIEEEEDSSSPALNLLLWSGHSDNDDDDDDNKGEKKNITCIINKNDEEDASGNVVGWPPIRSWRKKMLHQRQQDGDGDDDDGENIRGINDNVNYQIMEADPVINEINHGGLISINNSKYVKVKMEGMAITRKIDLTLFHSYQTLTNSLLTMFAKCQKVEKDGEFCYTMAYQDRDGDWLVAGDVPWQDFIQSVLRLKIVRNGG